MKILIFSWRGPGHPNEGGAEQATRTHALSWVKAGHEVTLFTSSFESAKAEEMINGIYVIRRGSQAFGVKLAAFWWFLFNRHPRFDLVVDEIHGIPFFTPLYVQGKKLAFIHEVAKEVWRFNPWPKPFNLIPAFVGTFFEPLIFRVVYRHIPFMTVSESTKKDLVNWGIKDNNITVVENGVTLDLPNKLPKKESRPTAIYLGALSDDKGIKDAVAVFSKLSQNAKWQFWVVGKGSTEVIREVKRLAKQMGVFDRTKFWGFVSEKKKFELLARAHVMVNPSIREGWGLVNIEANAAGTLVAGYKVPGMVDSVINGKTGKLVKYGDWRKLAEKITWLLANKGRYRKFQKAAHLWSLQFTWEKATKKSLRLIESL